MLCSDWYRKSPLMANEGRSGPETPAALQLIPFAHKMLLLSILNSIFWEFILNYPEVHRREIFSYNDWRPIHYPLRNRLQTGLVLLRALCLHKGDLENFVKNAFELVFHSWNTGPYLGRVRPISVSVSSPLKQSSFNSLIDSFAEWYIKSEIHFSSPSCLIK